MEDMIYKTKDYNIFKKHHGNRNISEKMLKMLKDSILHKNLLEFRPILVNSSMEVMDGQHRLNAARDLDLEIYYRIYDEYQSKDIILLNNNQKSWSYDDYCNYYENEANINYLRLRRFCESNGLSISAGYIFLNGVNGQNKNKDFKEGKFIFPEEDSFLQKQSILEKTSQILEFIKNLYVTKQDFLDTATFRKALMQFFSNPQVCLDTFKSKVSMKTNLLRKVGDAFGYVQLFYDIYNWRNHNPLELEE